MVRRSAALLAYLVDGEGPAPAGLCVFIAHMGGPLWRHRDDGAWSIPKGEYGEQESPRLAAVREFREEIGVDPPAGDLIDLGECRQPSGKLVRTFAVRGTRELRFVSSNLFELEWPRGSGRRQQYPEVDDARWFDLAQARRKLLPGQLPILAALEAALTDAGLHLDRSRPTGRGDRGLRLGGGGDD